VEGKISSSAAPTTAFMEAPLSMISSTRTSDSSFGLQMIMSDLSYHNERKKKKQRNINTNI
jgi:hypothetical protein